MSRNPQGVARIVAQPVCDAARARMERDRLAGRQPPGKLRSGFTKQTPRQRKAARLRRTRSR